MPPSLAAQLSAWKDASQHAGMWVAPPSSAGGSTRAPDDLEEEPRQRRSRVKAKRNLPSDDDGEDSDGAASINLCRSAKKQRPGSGGRKMADNDDIIPTNARYLGGKHIYGEKCVC